jgi:hypothetical protein
MLLLVFHMVIAAEGISGCLTYSAVYLQSPTKAQGDYLLSHRLKHMHVCHLLQQ